MTNIGLPRLRGIVVLALIWSCGEPAQRAVGTTSAPPTTQSQAATRDIGTASACSPAPNRLCPADDGATDPSFDQFRKELSAAVEGKNEAGLLKLIAPNVRTSFGGGGGLEGFKSSWKTGSADSKLWPTLKTLLNLGGNFQGEGAEKSFWAPYVYSSWPESVDAFEHVAAIRAGVALHATPTDNAPTVATVDWEILKLMPNPESRKASEWLKVSTSNGVEGWVAATDVYSPIGFRAGFSKRTGQWKLDALVSGD